MKKIFSIIFLFSLSVAVFGQQTTPRFGTLPNQDNTGRVLTYGYSNPAYASTYKISANAYETTVLFDTLTGSMTLTAGVKSCYVADKLNIIFVASGATRVVTFSTGFSSGGSISIASGATATVDFEFNGAGWIQTHLTGLKNKVGTAIPVTATITAAQLAGGLLTTTSAAAVTMTLPTATLLATQLGATQGTIFEFVVDNSAGANTVTVAVGSGITASTFPGTNTLTLANSATTGTAVFRITFISATAATLARIN